jgi:hypothetical protein
LPNGVLLISEKGSPLSCTDVDNNYLSLLQRGNHQGTQAASTIYDLAQAVLTIPAIQSLTSSLNQVNSQISDLQEQVLGQQGHVATAINILRTDLTEDITDLRSLVNQHTVQINGLLAADSVINQRIDSLVLSTNTSIDEIDEVIDCIRIGDCLLVPRPPDNQGDLLLGYDDDTNTIVWGLPLRLFCGPFVDGAFPVGGTTNLQLGTIVP